MASVLHCFAFQLQIGKGKIKKGFKKGQFFYRDNFLEINFSEVQTTLINLPGDPYLEGKSIEEFFKCQRIGAIKLVRVFTWQFSLYSPIHNPLIADVMINAVML